MVCRVAGVEDPIRDFRVATFGSNSAPLRVDLALLYGFMRWPVDHWVTLSKAAGDQVQYFAHWLNGAAIGTWSSTGSEPSEIKASVRPISAITAVNLDAEFYGVEGLDRRAVRLAVITFANGEDMNIDVRDWSGIGDQADEFIDHVIDAIIKQQSS